ncbi:MAG: ABC transporter ATP-binding protein [Acidaminobacteraceae bacterium]
MIKVKNLRFTYKSANVEAVKGISFEIQKGEIFGFLGPSGAGKSTTQNIMIKLLDGYEGEIEIFGKNLKSFGSEIYENIGVGFELPNHFLKLTARQNLEFFSSLYSNKTRSIDKLLERVGLEDSKDKVVENFSKGMKMRLNFVRALMNNADVLFLDEPTTGLDPVNSKIIKDIILEEKSKGRTIFITTHNMQVADDLCDRVAFIVDGNIAEMDKPEELKLKHGKDQVILEYYDSDKNTDIKQKTFELGDLGSNMDFIDTLKNHRVRTIHSQETTLEEVFIKVTGRRLY